MNTSLVVASLLVFAVVLSSLRLALRVRSGALAARQATGRIAAQAVVTGLLWLALFPPETSPPAFTLVVLTPGTVEIPAADPAQHRVALPGVAVPPELERVPDLATALRRHPGFASVRVLGHGLPARDQAAAHGLPLAFEPAPLPDGLHALDLPDRVVQGQAFEVRGQVRGPADANVQLLDPAGAVLAQTTPDADGAFRLPGRAGLAGPTDFQLRWQDADGQTLGEEALPLEVVAPARPRLLVLAGGPSPELKYLRRWAADTGLSLHTVIDVGGGTQLGDAPVTASAARFADFDLVVLDERAWAGLGANGRNELRSAVREGLGVLVRITGPLPERDATALRDWGLAVEDADLLQGLTWPGTEQPDVRAADSAVAATDRAPQLSRRPLELSARDGRVLHAAPDGEALVAWRQEGRGRVAASVLSDSYRLWLTGRRSAHGQLWADIVQTLARARDPRRPAPLAPAWLGERAMLCGLPEDASVVAPDGNAMALQVDPASGAAACAGYWPEQTGRHWLEHDGQSSPLQVRAPERYPAMLAAQRHAATQALVAPSATVASQPRKVPGPRWPWWLGWLLASAALWWFERRPAVAA
ncbi:hypothetical protein [Arenimonas donghaensis]|uniref:Carboxypeptidase regulatory-like domain-containing protein n=1 Tax=Arenimonas donghaensis DSM 18148 = HO3-R19 TaxID=1121014 RepID=A0A087MJE1_9GAMM|nr:hypothetical protein [Arenimonas donghaensis]KFL36994.1 hypothetical protein N788_12155 [Arenimonas donghaensis DSM 18148 = HO3-R19]